MSESFQSIVNIEADTEDDDKDEKIYQLRRELSLLKKLHREICVAYYVDNKSCSSYEAPMSAEELSIELGVAMPYRLVHGNKLQRDRVCTNVQSL